jgi:hypothetical protein
MALDEKNTWNHTWTHWIMLARNLGDFLRPTFLRWADENNKTPWKPKALKPGPT